ncbi:MAG TPA: hypothetical protein VM779_10510 [Thermoanaerobaculia bacterium]|nr:hypothetical protein [Thermoanaerobaculia bacterium]
MIRGAACLLLACAATLAAQAPSLNPTVTLLPQAAGPVPSDCDTAAMPQIAQPVPPLPTVPRPMPAAPQPVEVAAAPAGLPSVLREAHAAAVARDRASFDAALARAKAMEAGAAAERDVIAVLDDVQRLWNYQFTTPAGAFFDASVQDGSLLTMLRRYPGYDRAIEAQTITDASGTRYYPVRESIVFLLDVAGERLQRTGVRVDRIAEAPPRRAPAPAPAPVVERTQPRAPQPRAQQQAKAQPQPQPRTAPTTTRGRSRPRSTPQPAVAAPADEPALSIPTGVVSTDPAPVDLVPPTTTTAVLETMEPIAPDMAIEIGTTTAEEAAPASRGRSLIMPLVLILIGVGVLIVLFRASS